MSVPIIKFVLTAAMRDKILITFLLLVLIVSSLSNFFGAATTTEQSSFALVYKAGSLRFIGALSMILFTSFYVRRAFESKEVEFMLSRPISRLSYVLSHGAAFMLIAATMAMAIAVVVLVTGTPAMAGWILWTFSLVIEYVLVILAALFFAMVIPSAAGAALACLAFYALARMIGALLGIANLPAESILAASLGHIIDVISIFVPRLDLMGQTEWLVYGKEVIGNYGVDRFGSSFSEAFANKLGITWFIYLQGLVFSILLLVCTAFDFVRKQF